MDGPRALIKHAHSWTHTYVCTQHVTDPQTLSAEVINACHPTQPDSTPPGSSWILRLLADPGTQNTMWMWSCFWTELVSDTKRESAAQALGSGLHPIEQFFQSFLP